MGATALFIFYSPWTSPSGAQINPAVTLAFWRMGKMDWWDTFFYIIFQFIGGTVAVYGMAVIMGNTLAAPPVNYVVTVPGPAGLWPAFFTEFAIGFVMMGMVLFTSACKRWARFTRLLAGALVCVYVIIAGPVSGFGMNPARSFASALPAHNWTAFWLYVVAPVVSMLLAVRMLPAHTFCKDTPSCKNVAKENGDAVGRPPVFNKAKRFVMKQLRKFFGLVLLIALLPVCLWSQVSRIDAIGMTVQDMDRSVRFYNEVLGFKKVSDREVYGTPYEQLEGLFGLRMRIVRMQLGEEMIELTDYLTSGGRPIPADARSNDLSFQHIAIVVSDMEKAYRRLRKFGVEHVSTGPQTIPLTNVAAAGVKAFYFHDPDQHNLELIFFPKGKGQPKWQRTAGKLFLGIDHTAIGIRHTDSSLQFYRDLLGLVQKGDSWNKGTEQEHLNNVAGASLHITGLGAAAGPGIEFLEYLQPGAGKPYPSDSRADDIWYWQTTLVTPDAEALFRRLLAGGSRLVSGGVVELHDMRDHRIKAFVVHDPDGHALLIRGPVK